MLFIDISLKSILALVVILFGGVEMFVHFW